MKLRTVVLCLAAALARAGSPLEQAPPEARAKLNPYAGDERAARAGRKLYLRECAACHGNAREGIGKRPPLVSRDVADAPPGAIEWLLRNGSLKGGMPSFSHVPAPQRWQIVTYLKTLASGR